MRMGWTCRWKITRAGGPILPGAALVGDGPCTWHGSGDLGQGLLGKNGASLALTIIRPG